jgi:AcrR family transcriptional regulator
MPSRSPAQRKLRVADDPAAHEGSRARIHAAALGLFARYGYEGVSLQRIADEVGLHKSSLFHHYSGKAELLADVRRGVEQRVLERTRPLQTDDPPRLSTLQGVVASLVDHFSDEPEAARLLLATMLAPYDSELRPNATEDDVLAFYGTVLTWMERARRLGAIRHVNIRQAIPNLVGLVLFYPTVAPDMVDLVGKEPFSARARELRKQELARLVQAMLAPEV